MQINSYQLANIQRAKPVAQVRLVLTGTQPKLEQMLGEQARKAEREAK